MLNPFRVIFVWVKKIPTPVYGNYGGYYKRCKNKKKRVCPVPIDRLDELYHKHDTGKLDNWQLSKALVKIKPKNLKYKIYGMAHAYGAALIFSIATLFGVK